MATNEFWKPNSHVKIVNCQVHHVLSSIYSAIQLPAKCVLKLNSSQKLCHKPADVQQTINIREMLYGRFHYHSLMQKLLEMDVSSDSAHKFFNQWRHAAIPRILYTLLNIHETATRCHW
jgi:hypothetical protein